jgi:hypothetical protein
MLPAFDPPIDIDENLDTLLPIADSFAGDEVSHENGFISWKSCLATILVASCRPERAPS